MRVLDILEAASIMSLTFTHSRGSTEASTAGPILTSGQTLQSALNWHHLASERIFWTTG